MLSIVLKVKVRYGRYPHLTFTHITAAPVAYAAVFLNLNFPSRIISCHKSSGTYFSCCLVNINNSWTVIHNAVRRYGLVEELEDQENETSFAKVSLSAAPLIWSCSLCTNRSIHRYPIIALLLWHLFFTDDMAPDVSSGRGSIWDSDRTMSFLYWHIDMYLNM